LNHLITIIGPTAIGKTALSIALAQHFGCDIVSCDSRQFFKEMTIGTAVPSKKELQQATHHFVQNKSIFDPYTVGDFEKEALAKLNALFSQNNIQIMVGGSGLYVDAILKGLDNFPDIDPKIRARVRLDYEKNGIAFLEKQLQELDPNYYTKIATENTQTLQNPHRLMRFVEVCLSSGKAYSSFLNQEKNSRNFTPIIIGLEADREIMYDRINLRVDHMIADGLLAEAHELHPHKHLNALQTVGYRELFDYFDNQITLDTATEEIKKNTRNFAKRQLTWFKRTPKVHWFDYKTQVGEIIEAINSYLLK
jgi:tRNA dimethylallyltransferase